MVSWEIAFAVVPGLILFFYGIENFSREILAVASTSFNTLLGRLTSRPIAGVLLGAGVTALVQSSAATTIITVGLVNAGTLSFLQSLGIIIGSNIGTTVTVQLVAFKMTAFGSVLIPAGFLVGIFGGKYRFLGKPLFYFGLVFFSLNLVSNALLPFQNDPEIIGLIAQFSSLPLALLVGFLFTTLVQSSSVTTGLVVILAQQGLLTLPQAIPILLGANIGSTTTTLIASAKLGLYSRRAAAAHFLFNVGGVLLIIPFLLPFSDLVTLIGGTEAQMVANAHLLFNVLVAMAFLPFIGRFKELVERAVPGTEKEVLLRTRYLQNGLPENTRHSFDLIEKELRYSYEVTIDLFRASMAYLHSAKDTDYQMVVRLENLNDYLDRQIERALLAVSRRALNKQDATEAVYLVRMSNEIERLGDLGMDLGEQFNKSLRSGRPIQPAFITPVDRVYAILAENLTGLGILFPSVLPDTVAELRLHDISLREELQVEYRDHLERLKREDEFSDSRYLEILSIVEAANSKVRDLRKLAELHSRRESVLPPLNQSDSGPEKPPALGDTVAGDNGDGVAEGLV